MRRKSGPKVSSQLRSKHEDPLEEVSTIDSGEIEIVAEAVGETTPWTLKTVWVLMIVGGLIAIFWAAFPMFYFQNGFIGNLITPALSGLRYAFAGIGLGVGLLAASRGFGQSTNYLNTTSMLQIFCIVNFDVINFVIGIANIAFLNQSVTHTNLAISNSDPSPDPSPKASKP